MDRDAFVDLLNEDLELEFQSIVQYIQHIASVKGAEYQSTLDELARHVEQELQHALTLRPPDRLPRRRPQHPCARRRPGDRRARRRCVRTSSSRSASWTGTASAPRRPRSCRCPTSPGRSPHCSSRPRSTLATCGPRSAESAQSSSDAASLRSIVMLRLVLASTPSTRSHARFGTLVSVDFPRMRQWTSAPRTTRVSKSLERSSSARFLDADAVRLHERHEVRVAAREPERALGDDPAQLGGAAHERGDLEPELALEHGFDPALDRRARSRWRRRPRSRC